MRNRESILLEFEQLLNLLYSRDPQASVWRWQKPPFLRAVENFCRDAVGIVPSSELRRHATGEWLQKRELSQNPDIKRSVTELLNVALTAGK